MIALKESSKLISPLTKGLATSLLRLMGFRRVSVALLIEDLYFRYPKLGLLELLGLMGLANHVVQFTDRNRTC